MEHLRGFNPEQKFLRMTFVHATSGANLGMQQTLWVVTGEAAFLALIISHIESISKIISPFSLKWGIVLLVFSILCGVIAKHISMAVILMVGMTERVYKEFNSEEGQLIFSSLKTPINDLGEKLSEPFLWPLRGYMKRRFHAGTKDFLTAEKKAVRWLCFYIYFSVAQWFLGLAGILCFAFGIQQKLFAHRLVPKAQPEISQTRSVWYRGKRRPVLKGRRNRDNEHQIKFISIVPSGRNLLQR